MRIAPHTTRVLDRYDKDGLWQINGSEGGFGVDFVLASTPRAGVSYIPQHAFEFFFCGRRWACILGVIGF